MSAILSGTSLWSWAINRFFQAEIVAFRRGFEQHPVPLQQDLRAGAVAWLAVLAPEAINADSRRLLRVTCEAESELARRSDLVIATPIEGVACPLQLSPTPSTTAALAVGDALDMTRPVGTALSTCTLPSSPSRAMSGGSMSSSPISTIPPASCGRRCMPPWAW